MVGNAQKCVHTLLQLPDPPTAIIACNDVVAISALNTVHEMGLRVPEDISLIGFNNIPESANTFPPLTTIDSPTEILGQYAAELLLKVMSSEGLEDTEQIIDTKLIVRGSTGPCRSDNQ